LGRRGREGLGAGDGIRCGYADLLGAEHDAALLGFGHRLLGTSVHENAAGGANGHPHDPSHEAQP
jgi:hypothetical protein